MHILRYVVSTCMVALIVNCLHLSIAYADGDVILRGGELSNSITTLSEREFYPIKIIIKIWEAGVGPMDKAKRFRISFLDEKNSSNIANGVRGFQLNSIPIFDRMGAIASEESIAYGEQIPVYDWDSDNDCSLQKIILARRHDGIYVVVAVSQVWLPDDKLPVGPPWHQDIKIYKLLHTQRAGDDPIVYYFSRIAGKESADFICESNKIYTEMTEFLEVSVR